MGTTRPEPTREAARRFCHCGRPLRAGELCEETYDGHRKNKNPEIVASMARLEEALLRASRDDT